MVTERCHCRAVPWCRRERIELKAAGSKPRLRHAEETYIAYINGEMVSFGQLPGYPLEKYYDIIDVSRYCVSGVNELSVTVRYEGALGTATHIEDGAGSLCHGWSAMPVYYYGICCD